MVHHLYVHIPFCHRVCPYCSFFKHTPAAHDIPGFFRGVLAEARAARERWEIAPRTIYFGGGTPTMPSRSVLGPFLEEFRALFDLSGVVEWTFEANPRTFGAEKIRLLRQAGVTRVSLGVQAWDEPTLATLGRDHAPAEAREAYEVLRSEGVPTVNVDLMFSIPGQSLDAWRSTLAATVALGPDHVSAYNLNYEEDTEFFDRLTRGEWREDPEKDAAFFETALDVLGGAGLEAYEVSNHARAGHESAHNQAYWRGADYLGFGPGAFSTVDGRRWKNVADTALYTALATSGGALERETEHLTPAQRRTERIALLLRTREGLPLAELGPTAVRVPDLVSEGLALPHADRVILTPKGRLVADQAALFLIGD